MHVQFTHSEDLRVDADLSARLEGQIRDILGRFEDQLSAVVLHFNDQNAGSSASGTDKYCSIEARPNGHQPIAVHHTGNTVEIAAEGAARKMQRKLDGVLGKRAEVKGGESIRKTGSL
jgi:hypothetical protein